MKIIRVFPRRTKATPEDEDVRIKVMPTIFDEADEIHKHWKAVAPVKMGGPAFNELGGDFVPGMYMKKGYVITSRGCNNRCWFCSVPKRDIIHLDIIYNQQCNCRNCRNYSCIKSEN